MNNTEEYINNDDLARSKEVEEMVDNLVKDEPFFLLPSNREEYFKRERGFSWV